MSREVFVSELDEGSDPAGWEVTDEQMNELSIRKDKFPVE